MREDQRVAVLAAVRELSPALRQVVTCRYLLDLDEAETATVLGVPRGTVKSRLSRGLAKLRPLIMRTWSTCPAERRRGHA